MRWPWTVLNTGTYTSVLHLIQKLWAISLSRRPPWGECHSRQVVFSQVQDVHSWFQFTSVSWEPHLLHFAAIVLGQGRVCLMCAILSSLVWILTGPLIPIFLTSFIRIWMAATTNPPSGAENVSLPPPPVLATTSRAGSSGTRLCPTDSWQLLTCSLVSDKVSGSQEQRQPHPTAL